MAHFDWKRRSLGGEGEKLSGMRADELLVHKGLIESREKAKRLIMAGKVYINGEKVDKASRKFDKDSKIVIKEPEKYVSRGGYKIESAWREFQFDVKGKICCDIGASTGGFTDFLLQHGAKKVYAIDVGKGQLHWKLRNDNRVAIMEKTNARYIDEKVLGEKVDFVTCDVSFISILKISHSVYNILKDDGNFLILVKPQFEAPRNKVKKGIVKDKGTHKEVLLRVIEHLNDRGLRVKNVCYSGLRGVKGNIEYFVYGSKNGELKGIKDYNSVVSKVVERAHEHFGGNEG